MSRFVEVFRDLGSFSEVLQTQLELLLCERLTQTWVKVPSPSMFCLSGALTSRASFPIGNSVQIAARLSSTAACSQASMSALQPVFG